MHVLALSITGTPDRWLSIEHAAGYIAAGKVVWELGDPIMMLRGGLQRRTGRRSELLVPPVIALAKSESAAKFATPIPFGRDDNPLLARRDHSICAYCGDTIAPRDFTRDHVMPRARGGEDVWTNVVSAHRSCNQRKGCRTPEEAGMGLLYIPYEPCRAEYLILSGRQVLMDQMSYLAARLPAGSRLLNG